MGDIPDVGEMEGDVEMGTTDDDAELDEMKKRLKEIEEEAATLREMQAKVEKEMGAVQGQFFIPFLDFVQKAFNI
ncbi:hypothetical protein L1987_27170 [Smallanthus sonchifolius]|uniref:Uncharacterized protein n=1 Tax=Smallanthus sonchifolius TaxID=185202 RepID=A0ACB9IAV4_9ASTR|nr:hypothetical protein L1987_27170 [Smallanthus sonchifolius]